MKENGDAVGIENKKVTKNYTQSKYQSGTTSIPVWIITNTADTYELPETGGTGTTMLTLCGLILMAGALMYRYFEHRELGRRGNHS